MPISSDVVKMFEEDLAKRRSVVTAIERGELRFQERTASSDWRDTTQEALEDNKRHIALYEQLLAEAKTD